MNRVSVHTAMFSGGHSMKTVYELAVETWFKDKQWHFLWKDFSCFGDLPYEIQAIYCAEVRHAYGIR